MADSAAAAFGNAKRQRENMTATRSIEGLALQEGKGLHWVGRTSEAP